VTEVTVADSDAVRARRHRRHKAGDHSMCRPGCEDHVTRQLASVRPITAPAGDLDPRAEMIELARRLAAAHEACPERADVARELRATLQAIEAAEPAAADPMDELREMAARVS
jgi:hypothetical protein